MFTFGNRSLAAVISCMTTSVVPFSVFEVREKLGMLQKLLSSTAFLFSFFPEIIKRNKFSGKHFDLTSFYCEEFADRSEAAST